MIYFISGHRDLSKENFKNFYIPKINQVLKEDPNPKFVIGDNEGADLMAQTYLSEKNHGDKVTIYHTGVRPKHVAPGVRIMRGGYGSNFRRDSAMTKESDFDIAFICKPKKTRTSQNILRRTQIFPGKYEYWEDKLGYMTFEPKSVEEILEDQKKLGYTIDPEKVMSGEIKLIFVREVAFPETPKYSFTLSETKNRIENFYELGDDLTYSIEVLGFITRYVENLNRG